MRTLLAVLAIAIGVAVSNAAFTAAHAQQAVEDAVQAPVAGPHDPAVHFDNDGDDQEESRNWLALLYGACGPTYALLLPLSLLLSVWLIVILTRRDSPHSRSALLGPTILLPFFVGVYSLLDALLWAGLAMASSDLNSVLREPEIGNGMWQSVAPVMLSLVFTFCAFVFAHIRVYRLCRQAEQRNAAPSR